MARIQFDFFGNYKPLAICTMIPGKTAQLARDSLFNAPEDLQELTEEFLDYLFSKGAPSERATISNKGYSISWIPFGQRYEPISDSDEPCLPGLYYGYGQLNW